MDTHFIKTAGVIKTPLDKQTHKEKIYLQGYHKQMNKP